MGTAGVETGSHAADLYLDLLKKCLTRQVFDEAYQGVEARRGSLPDRLYRPVARLLGARGYRLVREVPAGARDEGRDWPAGAETMVGARRLDNLAEAVRTVLAEGVPGDLVECGVWRGGSCILMRGALAALGDRTRRVWVADSFRGLPPPDPGYPADAGDLLHTRQQLAIPIAEVKANFQRYGLLDERVCFLEGWFADTLPAAPIDRIAVLRSDGDMYKSTVEVLTALYDRVSPGGFVIVDDYGAMASCRAATEAFRAQHQISEPIVPIDWTGVYWRKSA